MSKTYWRSLGELAGSEESRLFREREFSEGASELPEGVTRRERSWRKYGLAKEVSTLGLVLPDHPSLRLGHYTRDLDAWRKKTAPAV